MATIPLTHAAGPLPASRREPAGVGRGHGLVGALLRAALCASSVEELDRCGVLRTAVAQSRPRPARRPAL